MRSRYEPSGDEPGEESDATATPVKAPLPAAPQYESAASVLRDSAVGGAVGLHEANANEALYSAFQQLHLLAQDFEKPFDAPAILVVGHQTDGKSALVEALMGFQFNHVGGGTKTRRPITLHMKYNSAAVQPACFLMTDDAREREVTLEELQEHIHQENARLEEEGTFWAKEIVVRIEYKYSPNLTLIDTPGLISAAPSRRNGALQSAARQVEAMVLQKMAQQDYIILCLEDSSDWNNATTRRTVMQVDPSLSRTVLVSTKFDTRLPQFSTAADVEAFLRAPGLSAGDELEMLGGSPFFTSVPSGRVGAARESMFRSNEQFREAVSQREAQDVKELEGKLGRRLDSQETSRLGVHQLRRFLEALLQRRYLDNVPAIVPLLEREHRIAEQRLAASRKELEQLATDKLKDKGRVFRETFLAKLSLLLRGTVAAPSEQFGETLEDEHRRGGFFTGIDGKPLVAPDELPNANMRLYGGAQFHRAMHEFRQAVGQMPCPAVSREEIVNACGVDDLHDGVNYVRTACVIAVSKARDIFEPLIHQLGYRLTHVLRRILPISMYLLQKDGACLSGHDLLLRRVGTSFGDFIEEVEAACKHRCLEDLTSTTRYVTWSLHTKHTRALRAILGRLQPDAMRGPGGPVVGQGAGHQGAGGAQRSGGDSAGAAAGVMIDLLECTLWQRQLGSLSEETVVALVAQVFEGIRDFIVQAIELKYNCFLLMPLIDSFPQRLREQLEAAWEDDLDAVFDVRAVRAALEARLRALEAEKAQVERLQRKFAAIHSTLAQQAALQDAPPGVKRSELAERLSLVSLSESVALTSLSKLRLPRAGEPRDAAAVPRAAEAATAGAAGGSEVLLPGAAAAVASSAVSNKGRAPAGSLLEHSGQQAAAGGVSSRSGAAAGALAAAAAAAAAGKLPANAAAAAAATPAVAAHAAGGSKAAAAAHGSGHPDGALTKGVRAHAVALSQGTLYSHHNA